MNLGKLCKIGLASGVVAFTMGVSADAALAEHQPHIKHSYKKHFVTVSDRDNRHAYRSNHNYGWQKERVAKSIDNINKRRFYSKNYSHNYHSPRYDRPRYYSNGYGNWNRHNSRPWYVSRNYWGNNRHNRHCD